MKNNQNKKKPRRYCRDYGHPTPTTVSPELRKREDELIDAGELSAPAIFKRLGFDRIGMNEKTFRGYASQRRRATGRRRYSKAKVKAMAELALLHLDNLFQGDRRFVDRVVGRMAQVRRVADVEAPR